MQDCNMTIQDCNMRLQHDDTRLQHCDTRHQHLAPFDATQQHRDATQQHRDATQHVPLFHTRPCVQYVQSLSYPCTIFYTYILAPHTTWHRIYLCTAYSLAPHTSYCQCLWNTLRKDICGAKLYAVPRYMYRRLYMRTRL